MTWFWDRLRDMQNHQLRMERLIVNNFNALNVAVDALSAKVASIPVSIDLQPEIDAVQAKVDAITASIRS